MKKAEISTMDSFGKQLTDKNKSRIHTEATKLLTDTYLKAEKSMEDIEMQVNAAQQAAQEIQEKSKEIASLLETGEVHPASRAAIHKHCTVSD